MSIVTGRIVEDRGALILFRVADVDYLIRKDRVISSSNGFEIDVSIDLELPDWLVTKAGMQTAGS